MRLIMMLLCLLSSLPTIAQHFQPFGDSLYSKEDKESGKIVYNFAGADEQAVYLTRFNQFSRKACLLKVKGDVAQVMDNVKMNQVLEYINTRDKFMYIDYEREKYNVFKDAEVWLKDASGKPKFLLARINSNVTSLLKAILGRTAIFDTFQNQHPDYNKAVICYNRDLLEAGVKREFFQYDSALDSLKKLPLNYAFEKGSRIIDLLYYGELLSLLIKEKGNTFKLVSYNAIKGNVKSRPIAIQRKGKAGGYRIMDIGFTLRNNQPCIYGLVKDFSNFYAGGIFSDLFFETVDFELETSLQCHTKSMSRDQIIDILRTLKSFPLEDFNFLGPYALGDHIAMVVEMNNSQSKISEKLQLSYNASMEIEQHYSGFLGRYRNAYFKSTKLVRDSKNLPVSFKGDKAIVVAFDTLASLQWFTEINKTQTASKRGLVSYLIVPEEDRLNLIYTTTEADKQERLKIDQIDKDGNLETIDIPTPMLRGSTPNTSLRGIVTYNFIRLSQKSIYLLYDQNFNKFPGKLEFGN